MKKVKKKIDKNIALDLRILRRKFDGVCDDYFKTQDYLFALDSVLKRAFYMKLGNKYDAGYKNSVVFDVS